ncbi:MULTISPECIES: DUF4192 family protein [Bifidobacterium]|uniref:Uncharacterized protein n=2 Tax=Bifidobacterium TaxID=1678 RepID=A0A261FTQ0_9BIFI|nr:MULTISPECIES: DUF4192 family protein [Bifidobacterium]OZG62468.1 hypothetical protein BLEM_1014 [Bifidobacterium lemurum]OZG69004.1 hypothetical protein BEUL_0410 [Bifidobacterium eulemuris]QOL31467.1 DUF4192 family protein [Bifidobacterium eulemuris]QOL33810.1 DUF4192 family protein [Bifidobacterium lemurum]
MDTRRTSPDIDTLTIEYRRECRENGIRKTDREWMHPVLTQWARTLETGHPLDDHTSTLTVMLMAHSLPFRDAIILSSLKRFTPTQLLDIATRQHRKQTVALITKTLEEAFESADYRLDTPRVERASSQLSRFAADYAGEQWSAQPIASRAYLSWIQGHTQAASAGALAALSVDPECALASIVFFAVEGNIRPMYL